MNVLLWFFQILLALHTLAGAVWKYSNTEQRVPSLSAIPHGVWLALGVGELLCGLGLILPAFTRRLGILAPTAAVCIAGEMLLFCGVNIFSGEVVYGEVAYWLVVAALSAFVAYGRLVLIPLWKPGTE